MCIKLVIKTNFYSEYVLLIAAPLQQWLHERTSIIRYTYIPSLVNIKLNISYFTHVCESLILCNYTFLFHYNTK
jgi:hypothetical protein